MITFIFIFGVLFRAIPMVGLLVLIWYVSRVPMAHSPQAERVTSYRLGGSRALRAHGAPRVQARKRPRPALAVR